METNAILNPDPTRLSSPGPTVLAKTFLRSGEPSPDGGGPPKSPAAMKDYKQPPAAPTQTGIPQEPGESQPTLFELGAPQW